MPNHSRASISVATSVCAAFILAGMTAYSRAESAQVHITFVKGRHAMQGFGNMFYAGERYRLEVEDVHINSVKPSRVDLIGTAENMHAASDILGIYESAEEGGSTIKDNGKSVRLKNNSGTILDIRAVNLGRLSLDLAGLRVTSRGWGPDAKERAGH